MTYQTRDGYASIRTVGRATKCLNARHHSSSSTACGAVNRADGVQRTTDTGEATTVAPRSGLGVSSASFAHGAVSHRCARSPLATLSSSSLLERFRATFFERRSIGRGAVMTNAQSRAWREGRCSALVGVVDHGPLPSSARFTELGVRFRRRMAQSRGSRQVETKLRGFALLCALAGCVLVLSGCKGEAPPSGSTDRVEHAPSEQPPTNTDTITAGAVFVQGVTLDGGAGDGGPNCTGAGDPTMGVDAGASCTGALGQATFQWAVCACNAIQLSGKLTTDGFNSALGGPDGGIGGNVGANGNVSWSSAGSIGGNLWTPDNVSESVASVVRGNLEVGGTVSAGATLTVDGNAVAVKTLPKNVTVLGAVSHLTSVAAPCDCSNPVPIGSIVAAHNGSNNDNASIGLSSTAAASGNPGHITLPCGNYYLTAISTSGALTIEATGHTALYVGGNIAASAALVFQVDTGATLDLFVAGSVTGSGPLTLGSTTAPAHCRAFVAGSSLALSATSTIGCNVYAPNAALDTSGALTVYGSLFASSVATSGNATVHFDTSIANAGGECCSASTCDDGNPCTVDSCNGDGTCSHTAAANGTTCTGANLCEQTYTCQAGACTGSNPVTCTASDQCHTVGACTPSTGQCSNPEATNGTACNDGNACTQTDACESGTCTGSDPVTCTASDACHVAGTCNPSTGACSNPPPADGTSCND